MYATHVDRHRGTNTHKHKNIHTASHPSPPDYLESTLKCNNERGNKLIIPISSLFMQAGSTVFLIILLFQRHPLGIVDCLCTPHAVMTTFPQNIWPCTMGHGDFIVFFLFSVFIVLRFLPRVCFCAIRSSVFLKLCRFSGISTPCVYLSV